MVRVLILFSFLAASAQMPTLIYAQGCCDATPCDSIGKCGCDSCGGCDAIGGCSSGCEKCDSCSTRDRLFGDLFGAKSCLAEHGIITDFKLGQYYQGVTTGGNEQTGAYGGKVDMYFNVLGKALGLNDGFALSIHAETRFGQDIGAAAGSLTLANAPMLWPLPGDYHGTNITGLIATQQILDGNVGLLAGKLNSLDLVQGILPDIGSGRESFLNVNALVTALPWFRFVNLSEWGAGFWTYDKERGGQIKHGLIVFGTENVSTDWDFSPSFEDGVGMLGWLRFFYEIGDKPGWVACFVGGVTRRYNSLEPSDWLLIPGVGPITPVKKRPGADVAPYISQVLWQDRCNKARNIRLTTGGTIADSNPSFSNWNVFSKLEAFGLQRSRPGDRMGIAGWYNGISDNVKDLVAIKKINVRDNWGIEMYYNREMTKWFHLTGDMQILQNSIADTDTSLVLGTRLIIDL